MPTYASEDKPISLKAKKVLLTGNCSFIKCKKRSTSAIKISDFWIEYCDDHRGLPMTLDKRNISKLART